MDSFEEVLMAAKELGRRAPGDGATERRVQSGDDEAATELAN